MIEKKWYYKPILIISLILILICIAGSNHGIFSQESGLILKLACGANMISLLAAIHYVFMGYKKDAAGSYKVFLYFCAFSELISVLLAASFEDKLSSTIGAFLSALTYGIILVMAAARDLGKVISFSLCGVIYAVRMFAFISTFVALPGMARGGEEINTIYTLYTAASALIAFLIGIFTYAKYVDKEDRGTK